MTPILANQVKQQEIINTLKVGQLFEVEQEVVNRIKFLKEQLVAAKKTSLILGISGGIDSTVTGRLAQLAVEQLRAINYPAKFITVRLPYGKQLDEQDARLAIEFIRPDKTFVINIKAACDESLQSILRTNYSFSSASHQDFILGNIKARQRMIIQYALAGAEQGLVVGTDHAAEALMGFFTKYGDGACDLAPLTGLIKRRIKVIGDYLGAPIQLIDKKPTADLENLSPQRLDEDVFGITYQEIDDFLEGKIVSEAIYATIFSFYTTSEHKRQLPAIPNVY
jgi:NAD+ synthase